MGLYIHESKVSYAPQIWNTVSGKSVAKVVLYITALSKIFGKQVSCKSIKLTFCFLVSLIKLVACEIAFRRYLFLAAEKGSTVIVYDITDPTNPVWQSAVYPGRHDAPWAELFNEKAVADIDPEGMEFIAVEDSPIGNFRALCMSISQI